MPASLSAFKVVDGEGNDHLDVNGLIQAVQDSLNAIGDSTKNAFDSGLIFDPAQIQQTAAATGDWLAWSGSAWDNAVPPATTVKVIADTLLLAPASSIDFSGIAGTFKHLRLIAYLRTDYSGGEVDDLRVRFNADAGNNYDAYTATLKGTTPTKVGNEQIATSGMKVSETVACDGSAASQFSVADLTISHYAGSANNKVARTRSACKTGTATGKLIHGRGTGAWRSNSAITQVTLTPVGGSNFKTGSRVVLYAF